MVRLGPVGLDQPRCPKAVEQGIDSPLTRHQSIGLGQRSDQIEPVAVLLPEQRKDAILDGPTAHLHQQLIGIAKYHAS